jgi:hypothetical protein
MHIRLDVPLPLMGHAGGHVTETGTPTKDWQGPPWKKEGGENCHAWEQGGRGRLPQAGAGRAAAGEANRQWPTRGQRPAPATGGEVPNFIEGGLNGVSQERFSSRE